MQSPDIKSAEILKDYKILLTFKNGERKIFDMKPYLEYTVFKPLNDENEFKKFSIIDGTIEWECGADLSTDTFFIESYDIDEKNWKRCKSGIKVLKSKPALKRGGLHNIKLHI